MPCRICGREAVSELCGFHEEARRKVEAAYEYWKDAYGGMGWNEYLDRVAENPETGQWAAEVAKLMREANGPS
jgi:hypothetical protein